MIRSVQILGVGLAALLLTPAAGAREKGGDGAVAHLDQAQALRARSREYLAAAVTEYRAVLQREPQNLAAERGLARALRDQGAEEEALPYLRDVAERSRDGVDHARLGWALFRAGRWAEAADAFHSARDRGRNDAETVQGAALASAAARAALVGGEEAPARSAEAEHPKAAGEEGERRGFWGTLLGFTGSIAGMVQRLLLEIIALVIVGGAAVRVWSTLMGRAASPGESHFPLSRLPGLPVCEVDTGRPLGRVRRALYDPRQARVVGFRTAHGWRRGVVPLTAARGIGPAGLILADAGVVLPYDRAPDLAALVRAGAQPLGPGRGRRRVVAEDGALLGYAHPNSLRLDTTTGDLTFAITPSRYHEAWRVTLSVLQFGPLDWILGGLLDRGFELLPGRVSARVRVPARLVRSSGRGVVIVSAETVEWIDRHFQGLEADLRSRLTQVKEGVARARPVLERVRDSGVEMARRGWEARSGAASDPLRPIREAFRPPTELRRAPTDNGTERAEGQE
jgi:hypothetical protein